MEKMMIPASCPVPEQFPSACGPGAGRPPRVFISYAHDDEYHVESVCAFAELLARCGLDVHLDRWDLERRRDWYVWAVEQVELADYVIVVASPMCRRAGDGRMENMRHQGIQSEMAQLRELLHSDRATWTGKLLPAVLPGGSISDIPLFLQPRTADHFLVRELTVGGVADLIRVMVAVPQGRYPAAREPQA
jgi:SEFIR domain